VVLVSHDAAQTRRIADWVIVLNAGRLTGVDPAEPLADQERT